MEHLSEPRPIEVIYAELERLEPKPIRDFVPKDAEAQKQAFLAGDIRNPVHSYDRLQGQDLVAQRVLIEALRQELEQSPIMPPKHRDAYLDIAENYLLKNRLMQAVKALPTLSAPGREIATESFMEANIALYGEPEVATYHGLLSEARQRAEAKNLTGEADKIRTEFTALMPDVKQGTERFKPSEETVAFAANAVEVLYGKWFRHIPEQEGDFTVEEVAEIFSTVIAEEYGESAEGWQVVLVGGTSINVSATERLVKIPKDRKPVSAKKMRGLLVHELGVHQLRSIMGDSLDIKPLRVGLSDYMDSEEGLARIMEMSATGKIEDAGIPHYLSASTAYFEGKDFRDTFEVIWRFHFLEKAQEDMSDEQVTAEVEKAKDRAYKQVFRTFRGTDTLPYFKDLTYYNGTMKVWEYLENQGQDINMFLMLLMGKADPTRPKHKRILLNAKTDV